MEIFNKMNKQYSHYCSWAIWGTHFGNKVKNGMDNLNIFDNCINNINFKYIIVGLNISKKIEIPLSNFHGKNGEVYKLRHALINTKLYGSYMTDIIKDFEEPKAIKMTKYIKQNPKFLKENINTFLKEINDLNIKNPILIAMGNDTYKILIENLKGFKIYKIPHYACRKSKEIYKNIVHDIIKNIE
jgi:hypothetical protein